MKLFAKFIFAAFVFVFITYHSYALADKDGPKVGEIPPPLTLTKTLQGLPSEEASWEKLKGKVVVLEFWATWCQPCVQSIPHLNELADQFKDKPVVFISVTSENEGTVRAFLKKHPINASIGLDDYEVLNKAFHIHGIPHAVIVNAEGRIAAITRPAQLEAKHLKEVLAGNKCSLPEQEVYTIGKSSDDVVSSEAPSLFEISIREHKLPQNARGPTCIWSPDPNGNGFEGKIATVESALNFVFDKNSSDTFIKCKLPDGFYDFALRAPSGHSTELKNQFIAALRMTFGLDVKQSTRTMDVYVLTQINTNAPGLRKVEKPGGGGLMPGGFRFKGNDMNTIAKYLEMVLRKPVFDESNLKGLFAVDLKWKLSEAEKKTNSNLTLMRLSRRRAFGLDWG